MPVFKNKFKNRVPIFVDNEDSVKLAGNMILLEQYPIICVSNVSKQSISLVK